MVKRLETRLSSIELNKQIVFLWHFDKRHLTLNLYNFLFAKYLLDTQSYHIDGQRVVHEGIFFFTTECSNICPENEMCSTLQ